MLTSRHWIADLGAAFISMTEKTASHEKYSQHNYCQTNSLTYF